MAEKSATASLRSKPQGLPAPIPSRANYSYTRGASVTFTSKRNQSKKVLDMKGDKGGKILPARKQQDLQKAELLRLQKEVSDLQKKLVEKDEALKSKENLKTQIEASNAALDDCRCLLAEKESEANSIVSELISTKLILAEKQAAVERLEKELQLASKTVEELRADVSSMDFEISALMKIFRSIVENGSAPSPRGRSDNVFNLDALLLDDSFDNNDVDMDEDISMDMDQDKSSYMAAITAVKENPSDEFLTVATEARLRLQATVL